MGSDSALTMANMGLYVIHILMKFDNILGLLFWYKTETTVDTKTTGKKAPVAFVTGGSSQFCQAGPKGLKPAQRAATLTSSLLYI